MINILDLENDTRKITYQLGSLAILEYERDISIGINKAQDQYFAGLMNIRRRQLVCTLNGNTIITQAGAMQWTAGSVSSSTGVKGVGDFMGKMLKGKVTKEPAIKPEYTGSGILVLEPTYRHILLLDVSTWGNGVTIEDGMFYACEGTVTNTVTMRTTLSSAVAGGEGLFNLTLSGSGCAALESIVPAEELITVELDNDEMKIDGNLAVCWSSDLAFSVEKSGKTLLGSALSGEGLVNVFRGTGKVMMSPVARTNN